MYHSHNGFYDSECKGFFFRICDVSSHHIFLQCFSNQRYCWWKTCFPHFLLTHFTVFILHPVLFPRPLYEISIGGVAALGNQNANRQIISMFITAALQHWSSPWAPSWWSEPLHHVLLEIMKVYTFPILYTLNIYGGRKKSNTCSVNTQLQVKVLRFY